MPSKRHRKHRPVAVETAVFKRQDMICACGCKEELHLGFIDFNHDPPLGLREFDEEADDYVPAENDPNFLFAMVREHHLKVTHHPRGPHTTIDSDLHAIRKIKRIKKGMCEPKEAHWLRNAARRARVKKKIQSRGFDKTLSKHMDGSVTKRP